MLAFLLTNSRVLHQLRLLRLLQQPEPPGSRYQPVRMQFQPDQEFLWRGTMAVQVFFIPLEMEPFAFVNQHYHLFTTDSLTVGFGRLAEHEIERERHR